MSETSDNELITLLIRAMSNGLELNCRLDRFNPMRRQDFVVTIGHKGAERKEFAYRGRDLNRMVKELNEGYLQHIYTKLTFDECESAIKHALSE